MTKLHNFTYIKHVRLCLFCWMEFRSGVLAGNQYQVQEEVGRPLSYALRNETSVKTLHTNFEVDIEDDEVSFSV